MLPLNRVVAFVGPLITLIAGGIAAFLVAQVNILGIPGLDKSNVATWIAAALTFLVTAGLHALGGMAWFKGHHILMQQGDPNGQAGPIVPAQPPTTAVPVKP